MEILKSFIDSNNIFKFDKYNIDKTIRK